MLSMSGQHTVPMNLVYLLSMLMLCTIWQLTSGHRIMLKLALIGATKHV